MVANFLRRGCFSDRPQNRGKNQTIIGAITLNGIIAALTFEGGTDSRFKPLFDQCWFPNCGQEPV
jgi:hypothetical protein